MNEMMSYDRIPDYTLEGFRRYVNTRTPTSGFIRACLENDLTQAYHRADDNNLPAIPAIVNYMYNELPGPCWGSPEKVKAWLVRGER